MVDVVTMFVTCVIRGTLVEIAKVQILFRSARFYVRTFEGLKNRMQNKFSFQTFENKEFNNCNLWSNIAISLFTCINFTCNKLPCEVLGHNLWHVIASQILQKLYTRLLFFVLFFYSIESIFFSLNLFVVIDFVCHLVILFLDLYGSERRGLASKWKIK